MRFGFPGLGRTNAARALLTCALLAAAPALVAPRSTPSVAALSLGGGSYRMTATVFGVPSDDLVGETTSSGHVLAKYDRLVALPGCTESSCPWVPTGTGVGGEWGPQTSCAEDDGLCWVEITSHDTGGCTVAPVLDLGPLFVKDNWWDLRDYRTYRLKKGLPAAEVAADGVDLGYGPGISDRGYDVQDDFPYAAAIDLAAGTWVDLGLDLSQGIGEVEVTLLWQAGLNHDDACGGYGNARTVDWVNLRAGPSTDDDVLTVLDTGDRLGIIGGGRNGFYPVVHDGLTGWVFADYVRPDGATTAGVPVGIVTERLNLRAGPSTADDVLRTMPAGTLVVLRGEEENGFLSISVDGADGWAFAAYLDTGHSGGTGDNDVDGADVDGGGSQTTSAITTDRLNLRSGPSLDDKVLLVMPDGADVTLTGKEIGGFFSLEYQGTKGWAHGDYLSTVRRVTENLNLRAGPSTGDDVIVVMPAGARVALLGGEENGFVTVRYHGREGWAYAAYLD